MKKRHSNETKRKISETRKNRISSGKITFKSRGKTYEEMYGLEKAKQLKEQHSERFKQRRKNMIPWNKGKRGLQVAWNKGLTKEDLRVQKYILSGKNSPHFGKSLSEEHKRKISLGGRGVKRSIETREKMSAWQRGVPKSEIVKQKISQTLKRQRLTMTNEAKQKQRETWNKNRERNIRNVLKATQKRPNGLETKMIGIVSELKIPFEYVGDGSLIIGGLCPDFVNKTAKKELIEVFGSYWHEPREEKIRGAIFRKYGYRTLVVWDYEFNNKKKLLRKITKFTK